MDNTQASCNLQPNEYKLSSKSDAFANRDGVSGQVTGSHRSCSDETPRICQEAIIYPQPYNPSHEPSSKIILPSVGRIAWFVPGNILPFGLGLHIWVVNAHPLHNSPSQYAHKSHQRYGCNLPANLRDCLHAAGQFISFIAFCIYIAWSPNHLLCTCVSLPSLSHRTHPTFVKDEALFLVAGNSFLCFRRGNYSYYSYCFIYSQCWISKCLRICSVENEL